MARHRLQSVFRKMKKKQNQNGGLGPPYIGLSKGTTWESRGMSVSPCISRPLVMEVRTTVCLAGEMGRKAGCCGEKGRRSKEENEEVKEYNALENNVNFSNG